MRVNNPMAFGMLCALILILVGGLTYALAAGVIAPGVAAYRESKATPSPTPTIEPVSGPATPTPTPDPTEAATPSPDPALTPTPSPTPAGRLSGRVIGLDPARGYTSKVRGTSSGVYANRLNLSVANLVKDALEAEGATVVMTYTDPKTTIDSKARAAVLNNGKVEAALRIECNYVDSGDTRGALMWAPAHHASQSSCEKLAKAVLDAYIATTELPLRPYNDETIRLRTDQDLFNACTAPVCTLIMGHISNKTDDTFLNDEANQKKIARAITEAFVDYFG